MEYQIRKATREDLPQVLELIKELAAYENASHQVEITVADLEKEGFEKENFTCFVADENWKGWLWCIAAFQPGKDGPFTWKILS